jgi:predicted transcriptional regulator
MKKIPDSFTKNEILELVREFKRRRSFLDISQLKLAKFAGLSQSIINKFENGKIDPTYSTILKIDRALSSQEKISNVKAFDVMISDIVSVNQNTIISDALNIMRENDFSQLLVMDKDNLVGTIYEKSILDAIANRVDIYKEKINSILDLPPIIIPKDYMTSDLAYIFSNSKTKFVLVEQNNKILGIVTKSDLFKN